MAVTLTMTIASGETVEIYTAKDEQYAIYHATAGDTSAFPYLDYDTNLSDMVLKPGTKDCELDTDSSGTGSSLMVQWRHTYGGI